MKQTLLFIILFCFAIVGNSQIIFQEDFDGIPGVTAGGAGTYAFPSGWLLVNVDNLTPNSSVAYVNQAWTRREDFSFNVADSCAFSTSWYLPTATSDDWMWTPVIGPLPNSSKLKWKAVAYDATFQDGYEVRIMTDLPTGTAGNMGNMLTNSTVLFSTTAENSAWTDREVDLSSYQGQSVYIGFRNNSSDKFLLLIDDIVIEQIVNYDIQITNIDTISQYTKIPLSQTANAGRFGATIKNGGLMTLHNVELDIEVKNQNGVSVYFAGATMDSLVSNTSAHLSTYAFTPMHIGTYFVTYKAIMAETDDKLGNDTVLAYAFEVTDSVYARDDSNAVGSLGIGAGVGGYLGQDFSVKAPAYLTSISVEYTRGYVGKPFAAAIWNMQAGVPDTIIATTDTLLYPDDLARFYTLDIANAYGHLLLTPGDYAVTAIEFDSTLAVAQVMNIFTPNHTWVNWSTSPMNGWASSEDFGSSFARSSIIRMNFYDPCLSLNATITSTNATCSTCSDGTATVNVSGGISPYQYNWSNNETTVTSANLYPGDYIVTITDTIGCSVIDTVTIDFVNSISDISENNVVVFPNPNNGTFNIECASLSENTALAEILDVTGKIVYSKMINQSSTKINTLSAGVYTLRIQTKETIIIKKIVVN